ncbi:MAG TPA: c-type cytochrome [Bryobacterales bacterium]|nr:c-type cytochrome [Bryobacterales bacterium]
MKLTWLLAAALCAAPAFAQPAPSDAAAGAGTYRVYCSECHGREGHGGRGPDLTSGRWTHGSTDADIARVIAKGVPGTGMPAWGGDFDDTAVRQLVAFVRSLNAGGAPVLPTGNAERGQESFWGKGNCGACHMVSGRGGRLGPELTRIGAQRSLAYLRESIVKPSADIAPGYEAVRVRPRRGSSITGIRKNEDNFTIQIFDTSEKYHSFQKADLDSLEEMPESLMPPGSLSPAEVDDVVAYLDTLRGKP